MEWSLLVIVSDANSIMDSGSWGEYRSFGKAGLTALIALCHLLVVQKGGEFVASLSKGYVGGPNASHEGGHGEVILLSNTFRYR